MFFNGPTISVVVSPWRIQIIWSNDQQFDASFEKVDLVIPISKFPKPRRVDKKVAVCHPGHKVGLSIYPRVYFAVMKGHAIISSLIVIDFDHDMVPFIEGYLSTKGNFFVICPVVVFSNKCDLSVVQYHNRGVSTVIMRNKQRKVVANSRLLGYLDPQSICNICISPLLRDIKISHIVRFIFKKLDGLRCGRRHEQRREQPAA
jgi:hypothetical protein